MTTNQRRRNEVSEAVAKRVGLHIFFLFFFTLHSFPLLRTLRPYSRTTARSRDGAVWRVWSPVSLPACLLVTRGERRGKADDESFPEMESFVRVWKWRVSPQLHDIFVAANRLGERHVGTLIRCNNSIHIILLPALVDRPAPLRLAAPPWSSCGKK